MIYLGADHAGFKLKETIKSFLKQKKIMFVDLGSLSMIKTDDYPLIGSKLARRVRKDDKGILLCGSSFGVCIVANKIKGIRAVSATTKRDVVLSRKHNDANVLCLSGWNTSKKKASELVSLFLSTPFSNEPRHIRRIQQIRKLE